MTSGLDVAQKIEPKDKIESVTITTTALAHTGSDRDAEVAANVRSLIAMTPYQYYW